MLTPRVRSTMASPSGLLYTLPTFVKLRLTSSTYISPKEKRNGVTPGGEYIPPLQGPLLCGLEGYYTKTQIKNIYA